MMHEAGRITLQRAQWTPGRGVDSRADLAFSRSSVITEPVGAPRHMPYTLICEVVKNLHSAAAADLVHNTLRDLQNNQLAVVFFQGKDVAYFAAVESLKMHEMPDNRLLGTRRGHERRFT